MSEIGSVLQMGGYAFYVWGAYGLTAAVMIANALLPRRRERRLLRSIAARNASRGRGA